MEEWIFWMLLNGWLAKHCFEIEANWSGWFCLFVSAFYLARVMQSIF